MSDLGKQNLDRIDALQCEVAELRLRVVSARAQAFEEAAKIAEDMTAARRAYSPRALGTLTPECEIASAIMEHAKK